MLGSYWAPSPVNLMELKVLEHWVHVFWKQTEGLQNLMKKKFRPPNTARISWNA